MLLLPHPHPATRSNQTTSPQDMPPGGEGGHPPSPSIGTTSHHLKVAWSILCGATMNAFRHVAKTVRCRRSSLQTPLKHSQETHPMLRKPLALATLAAVAALLPLAAHAQAQGTPGPYKVLQIVKVGGDGGMDYVTADSANRNLYVARSGAAGHIGVFNLDTFKQVGDIPNTSGHGAVVDDITGHGFATSRAITMFHGKTFAIIKTIPV